MRQDLVLFPARALDDPALTRAHLKVLYHLGRYADFKTGWCYPSLSTIAEVAGVSRPTVTAALSTLVAGGYVRKESRQGTDGRNENNRYMVVLDPPAEASKAAATRGGDSKAGFTTPSKVTTSGETGDNPVADNGLSADKPAKPLYYPSKVTTSGETQDKPQPGSSLGNGSESVGVSTNTHLNTHAAATTVDRPENGNGALEDPATLEYLVACTRAANRGLRSNPAIGSTFNEIIASNQDAHHAWHRDRIPLEVATRAIDEKARTLRLVGRQRPPTSLAYFDGAVRDAADRQATSSAADDTLSEAEQLAAELTRGGQP